MLARCRTHGKPHGTANNYVVAATPMGLLDTAAICGRVGCNEQAQIWLTDSEKAAYEKGQRVFAIPNNAVKIRVSSLE